jgi:putative DNA primase/helicase
MTGRTPLTDLGNAERLVAQHGRELRYVPGLGWHAWDGRRWAPDQTGEPQRRAKLTVRSIMREAADCDDDTLRAKTLAWARQSESEPRLRAAVSLAQSEQAVVAVADDLNADPWLLTVANGTIDLRTSRLRPHDPADLITKLAPAVYDPAARSERWERLLERATGGDAELLAFLQRFAGYTIAGVTSEEVLAFVHGPGNAGKTTFVGAIQAVLGDYATTADFDSFVKRRGDAGVRNDIARLAGARMVVSVEVDEGKALAEGLIKSLTGGDRIAARYLYRESFEFTPCFTMWLVANTRPSVRADDDAMWRRIHQLPFTVVIPEAERDNDLKAALHSDPAEQAAVLAWLVQGCLEWQRRGLAVPQRVRDYTAEYRAENDPIAEWIKDECEIAPENWAKASDLRARYERWCESAGVKPIDSGTAWGKALTGHGCAREKRRVGHGWQGIGLLPCPAVTVTAGKPLYEGDIREVVRGDGHGGSRDPAEPGRNGDLDSDAELERQRLGTTG